MVPSEKVSKGRFAVGSCPCAGRQRLPNGSSGTPTASPRCCRDPSPSCARPTQGPSWGAGLVEQIKQVLDRSLYQVTPLNRYASTLSARPRTQYAAGSAIAGRREHQPAVKGRLGLPPKPVVVGVVRIDRRNGRQGTRRTLGARMEDPKASLRVNADRSSGRGSSGRT